MKSSVFISIAALLAPTNAHYLFGRLIFNSQWTSTWEYVREVSPRADSPPEYALPYPNVDPTSPDLRCGRNATLGWSKPKVATVKAGDTVGFGAGEPMIPSIDPVPRAYHPGFGSAWMSKAEGELNDYAGDGDWFKILQIVGRTEQSVDLNDPAIKKQVDPMKTLWGTYLMDSWNFTIPASTPSGKYLLRFEHIFPNAKDAQFYVNCAHIEVVNPSETIGTPGPNVKIPGVYVNGQPDVYFSSYDYAIKGSLDGFVPPKPEVWEG